MTKELAVLEEGYAQVKELGRWVRVCVCVGGGGHEDEKTLS